MNEIYKQIENILKSLNIDVKNIKFDNFIFGFDTYVIVNSKNFNLLAIINNNKLEKLLIKEDNIVNKFHFISDYTIHQEIRYYKEENIAISIDTRSSLFKNNSLLSDIYNEKTVCFNKDNQFIYDREYILDRFFIDNNIFIESIDLNKRDNIVDEKYGLINDKNKFIKLINKEEFDDLLKDYTLKLKK